MPIQKGIIIVNSKTIISIDNYTKIETRYLHLSDRNIYLSCNYWVTKKMVLS